MDTWQQHERHQRRVREVNEAAKARALASRAAARSVRTERGGHRELANLPPYTPERNDDPGHLLHLNTLAVMRAEGLSWSAAAEVVAQRFPELLRAWRMQVTQY